MKKTWQGTLGRSLGVSRPPVQTEQQEKSAVGPVGRGQIQMGEVLPAQLPSSIHSQAVQEGCANHLLYAWSVLGPE